LYFLQHRLRVERVDVRDAAVHEQEDDPLRLGLEVELLDDAVQLDVDGLAGAAAACASERSACWSSATRPKPPPMRDRRDGG
jgi:hypothetical protein